MKRFLVLADTHGITGAIDRALGAAGAIDGVIHLGDYVRDAEYIRMKGYTVFSVKGNCDFNSQADAECVMHVGGKKLFLTHGHHYGVKYSLNRLIYKALEMEADAVLFGHTHAAVNGYEQGVLFLNPGSISEPRNAKPTYAIMEISDKEIIASLKLL